MWSDDTQKLEKFFWLDDIWQNTVGHLQIVLKMEFLKMLMMVVVMQVRRRGRAFEFITNIFHWLYGLFSELFQFGFDPIYHPFHSKATLVGEKVKGMISQSLLRAENITNFQYC